MPRQSNTDRLRKEFPFVEGIISMDLDPIALNGNWNTVDVLTIRAKRADAPLMYRRPATLGLEDPRSGTVSWTIRGAEGDEKPEVGSMAEYFYTVEADGLHGPYNMESHFRRVRDILAMRGSKRIDYLVWVTVNAWHDPYEGEESNLVFGDYKSRGMKITIYKPPADGFDELLRTATFDDAVLSSRELLEGALDHDPDIDVMNEKLGQLATEFRDQVIARGLHDLINDCQMRGMSGMFGGVDVRSYVLAGRVAITLETPVADISFIGIEGSEIGYWHVHGIHGSYNQVAKLVRKVAKAWEVTPDKVTVFTANEKVGIM